MKKIVLAFLMFFAISVPATSFALGMELAVGGWYQDPQGYFSYDKAGANDTLDVENDLKYDSEARFTGRLKVDMPLFIPNVYLMATPMKFDGNGRKNVNFKFGDVSFNGNEEFKSELKLDHYDIALYYGLPFLKTATLDRLNIDLGINVRIVDFEGRVKQTSTGLSESESTTLPIPMGYISAQFMPLKGISMEGEARGIAYSSNHYYSLIGRVKVDILGPLFGAAGYRYDSFKIDEEDIDADVSFRGPFVEIGLQF